jgi:hypothetical protein
MQWQLLVELWREAHISDRIFLQYADCMGKAHRARELLRKDLDL